MQCTNTGNTYYNIVVHFNSSICNNLNQYYSICIDNLEQLEHHTSTSNIRIIICIPIIKRMLYTFCRNCYVIVMNSC